MPKIKKRLSRTLSAANREPMGEHHGIYRPGTRRADAVNCETRLLKQPIQYTPSESPVSASALKRRIGVPSPLHRSDEFCPAQLRTIVHGSNLIDRWGAKARYKLGFVRHACHRGRREIPC
jgi:hypothetical protein